MGTYANILIAGFTFYVLWTVVRPRWHFKIIVKPEEIKFVNGVSEGRRRKLESFFLQDVKPSQKLTICGRRESSGRLTTLIKGTDDAGMKQRIRNFLLTDI